ncbi:MAG: nucleotidyltransferase family protein [Acidobacteriaceae bacterium]|jgi:CTP:molybdopterin cytidylyltransferase MocA
MRAAVVLAAGASTRLGEPKQLAMVGGERLLERAVRVAREAGCVPVVVVLGARAEAIRAACGLGDAMVVVHEGWGEGMGASIRVGVRACMDAVGDAEGVVVMTCDQPAVTAEHLLVLMATGETTASGYAGRRGVPAYFPAGMFGVLLELKGDAGARELLREARVVELVGGELDVDTAEGLAEARRVFG